MYKMRFIYSKKRLIILLTIIMFIIVSRSLMPTLNFCDPAKPLWWFCAWPDPYRTVCSWKDHFPSISSYNKYEKEKEKKISKT